MNYSVTVVTPKGLLWLSSPDSAPLCVMLPSNMVRVGQQHAAGSSMMHFVLALPAQHTLVPDLTVHCNTNHVHELLNTPLC
jgi:hypothetical protein